MPTSKRQRRLGLLGLSSVAVALLISGCGQQNQAGVNAATTSTTSPTAISLSTVAPATTAMLAGQTSSPTSSARAGSAASPDDSIDKELTDIDSELGNVDNSVTSDDAGATTSTTS